MNPLGVQLVDCARVKLRLSSRACARNWLATNPVSPPVWEGRVACHGCPAGAVRAGGTIDPAAAVRDKLASICPRCRKTSDRIIKGRLCVSCYNRDLEVQRGYNRKGRPPIRVAARLFACQVMAIEADRVDRIEQANVAGVLEVAIWRARRAKDASLAFGWAPPVEKAA